MRPIDYQKLLQPEHVSAAAGDAISSRINRLDDNSGLVYIIDDGKCRGRQEIIRFNPQFILLFGEMSPFNLLCQHQLVRNYDWIHIQFRVLGDGTESIGGLDAFDTPAGNCIVARYPRDTIVTRAVPATKRWRVACLYVRPRWIRENYFESRLSRPIDPEWLHADVFHGARWKVSRLGSRELISLGDIFSCDFNGGVRKTYLFSKALELLSIAVNRVIAEPEMSVSLSNSDRARIAQVRNLLEDEIQERLTLGQIARRVGVNRSKLAFGFKSLYGTSVQAYRREIRLTRARDLLMSHSATVTEVAAEVGYSDISCFTRAFCSRYGISPRDCKRG